MVSNLVIDEHKTLAKELYDFLVAPAAEFEFHYTYWHNDHAWVTESEMETMDAGIVANLKTLFGITGTDTLIDKLNVKVTPVVLDQTTVGALGTATLALRDNAGTDLIIGCGKNVISSGGVATVCKDTAATSFMAAGRYVALINHNFLAEHIYTSYFGLTIPEA